MKNRALADTKNGIREEGGDLMGKDNWIWLILAVLFLGNAIIVTFNLSVQVAQGIFLFLLAVACIVYFATKR